MAGPIPGDVPIGRRSSRAPHWLVERLRARGYTSRGDYWSRGRVSVIVGGFTVAVALLPDAEGDEPEGWRVTLSGNPPRPLVRLVLDVAEMASAGDDEQLDDAVLGVVAAMPEPPARAFLGEPPCSDPNCRCHS